ncbi:MAG: PRC-barrel domain-containing protein [Clostridia bacterium]|nr:PRC-barrel domain-containing protein [Clostridia bacterium]MDD4048455.1 PRC-barrel domain-containing protein [Clostridia bacterium]
MRKGREVKNLPVIDIISGRHLGYVSDFKTVSHEQIQGIYMVSLEDELYYIPLNSLGRIGKDAIMIKQDLMKMLEGQSNWVENCARVGQTVLTSIGNNLGIVSDIVIEEKDGSILGLEVSDGYLKDVFIGRKIIATSDVITWGKDTIIVNKFI